MISISSLTIICAGKKDMIVLIPEQTQIEFCQVALIYPTKFIKPFFFVWKLTISSFFYPKITSLFLTSTFSEKWQNSRVKWNNSATDIEKILKIPRTTRINIINKLKEIRLYLILLVLLDHLFWRPLISVISFVLRLPIGSMLQRK